ncbi:uncharacterized protein LOC119066035 [Bradysia coprophila]|uniref:uncharacterized protein LOC119066035 n=1 Tax=Bradysia coprophila TaxID=38358 RepID=UPI00187DC994|nr:uncharacterized protein LOC119066035 [Bradysia coprophila]
MSESSDMLGAAATSGTTLNSEVSSRNILDILNDDCIGHIFRQLEHLEDLFNAATTCKRFWECAMSLKFRFRSVAIENTHHAYSRKDVVSAHNAPALLRHFGQLAESVELRLVGNQQRGDEIFELLEKFCGKTLRKLTIANYNPNFNIESQFPALEHLTLYNAEPINFWLDSPLKHLAIQNFSEIVEEEYNFQPWFVRNYPHLESVYLNTTEICYDTLTVFLAFNQQLPELDVHSEYLTPMIFQSIGLYSRNIQRLKMKCSEFQEYDSSYLHEELLNLSGLRKLTDFGVSGRLSLELLFKMFAENNTPIRSLEVDIAATDGKASIPTIRTLNKLQCICRADVDENSLINLAKSQPALQILQVTHMGSHTTIKAIEKILNYGRNLTDFEVSFCSSYIDMESYNRILLLAKNRVKVRITVPKRSQVNVPADILKVNRNWVRIMFDCV